MLEMSDVAYHTCLVVRWGSIGCRSSRSVDAYPVALVFTQRLSLLDYLSIRILLGDAGNEVGGVSVYLTSLVIDASYN